jgi:PAS domain S-box-containing protein
MADSHFAAHSPTAEPSPKETPSRKDLQARIAELEQNLQDCHTQLEQANAVIHQQTLEIAVLEKREEYFRLALDLTKIASWDWNLISGEVVWNDNHYYLLGYQLHEVAPSYEIWYERVHPDDREWVEQHFLHAVETQATYEVEYRITYPDGSLHWLFDKGLGVYDEAGKAVRMIGITMDISERKQTETALRRSEEQHRLTLELTHIGCWMWDLSNDDVLWNDNHFRLLGYRSAGSNVHYHLWRDRVHPEDIDRVEALQSHALKTHTDYTAEYRVIHPDGSLHWMMSRGRGVYDASGQAKQMVGVIIDISDRKWAEVALQQLNQDLELRVEERTAQLETVNQQLQAQISAHEQIEAALRRSEERLRIALEAAHMGVWEMDLATGTEIWSAESEQLFGFAPGTFNGTRESFMSRLHPEDQARLPELIQQAIQTGQLKTEYRVIYPDQSLHWIAAMGKVFLNAAGQPSCINGVDIDITERKQSEDKIRSALNEKEVLLKEIHHRVKNNLQIISSLLRMQARQAESQQTAALFQEAQNRVRSMALIHEQLYQSPDLSHIHFGRYIRVLVNQLFQCYGVEQNAIAWTIEADELPLSLNTAIPCGLIVNELVSNALKYAFPGDRSGTITIQLKVVSEEAHTAKTKGILIVADNGVGIPSEVDWQTTSSLGLRIVRNLVTQLNGQLTIDHCSGTTFQIIFPYSSHV